MSVAKSAIQLRVPILAVAFLALALGTEWLSFFALWRDSILYSHGFLVLAGTLFLLFRKRNALSQLQATGSALALVGLAGSIAALILAQTADIRLVQLFVTPFILLFWGWAIWGKAFVRIAGGPILLLLFAVPFWDDFSPLLQRITVFFNEILLNIVNVPAQIKDFYIILDVGVFLVNDGCSGIRYLMVGLFLATFYGQLFYRSYRSTIILVLAAALLSMLANWIRVFGIILLGHYTDMQSPMIADHEFFGWVVFVVLALVPIFLIAGRLEPRDNPPEPDQNPPARSASGRRRPKYGYLAVASALLLLPALLPMALSGVIAEQARSWQPELFTVNENWTGPLKYADFWQPAFRNPDIELAGVYVSADLQRVQAQLVGYRQQGQGKELVYYQNSLFDPQEWHQLSQATVSLPGGLIPGLGQLNETVIQNLRNGLPVIVWSWYELPQFRHHSPTMIKLVGALKQLTGNGRGALRAVAAECHSGPEIDCDSQRTMLREFLGDLTDYP